MTSRRIVMTTLMAGLIATLSLPAAATTLIQTFEHETWDEKPDQTIAEAVEALREVHPYLVDVRNADMTRTRRVNGYVEQGLEVKIPTGFFRGFGPYARLPEVAEEAWYRYYVYLSNFRPVGSGKLPGLADASRTLNAKGCKPSTPESPGWSARMMFDRLGTLGAKPDQVPIGFYVYHAGQQANCGDELIIGALDQRRWTCIEGHIRMNTPGQPNGLIEGWIDGERVFREDHFEFRRAGEALGIREMWNNVYFGGSYPTPNDLSLILDEMVVSTTGRVGCLDPFTDDNDSVHESSITELHARRLFYGCGARLACPHDYITRAEFASILHRAFGGPKGSNAFIDDDGHWAEAPINSLAAQGILRGCNPPANTRVCPEAFITRAEAAAMVRRLLGLPKGPDAFEDDRGSWAEGDINALAAAGISRGCNPPANTRYCPERSISRDEAATFTLRIDNLLSELTTLAAPDLPEWPPLGPPPEKPPEEQE